ncbi:methionine synthase, partial [bacterium]
MEFEKIAKSNVLIMDGAMGTMLIAEGLRTGESPEAFMLEHPETVQKVHSDYVAAGAQILTTNTFGASRTRLAEFGLGDKVDQICALAVGLAKKAAGEKAFIAGSIGPLGVFLPPFGEMNIDEAYDAFSEQARALESAGADLLVIETMTDLREAQLALRAAKSAVRIPIIAHLAFNEADRTVTGTSPDVGAVALGSTRPFGIGTNCGGKPEEMVENIRRMRRYWDGPLSAEPNAGVPT